MVGPVVILPNFELRPVDAVAGYRWFVVILPNSSPLQQNRCHWEIDGIERGPDTPDPILLNVSYGLTKKSDSIWHATMWDGSSHFSA